MPEGHAWTDAERANFTAMNNLLWPLVNKCVCRGERLSRDEALLYHSLAPRFDALLRMLCEPLTMDDYERQIMRVGWVLDAVTRAKDIAGLEEAFNAD